MTQVSAAQLRALIRETIAGQGLPWGGVREAEEWVPGQKTRTGTLTRKGNVSGKMSDLHLVLHGLYVDAAHLPWRSPEYNEVMGQIESVKEELASLQSQHDELERELATR